MTSSFSDAEITQITNELKITEERLRVSEDGLRVSEDGLRVSEDGLRVSEEESVGFMTSIVQSQQEEIELKVSLFRKNIDTRADIVLLLSDTVEIQRLAKISEYSKSGEIILGNSLKESVQKKLYHFGESDPEIDHVRILDMSGMEIIRIDRVNLDLIIVPDSKLQNKSDRYYFKEAVKLEKNTVYISDIDLNVEQGKIEIPHKPTLRIATIIHDSNNEKLGILIINYVMDEYLLFLSHSPICNIVIFDHDGTIIQHQDKEKVFGLQLGTGYSYYTLHPDFKYQEQIVGISPYYDEKHQHHIAFSKTQNYSTEDTWHFVCESTV